MRNDASFQRTTNQCYDKIKNLREKYKKVKDNSNQMGNLLYDKLDTVFGSKPAITPPMVNDLFLDSS